MAHSVRLTWPFDPEGQPTVFGKTFIFVYLWPKKIILTNLLSLVFGSITRPNPEETLDYCPQK
jgi:hypothetical protein